MIERFMFWFKDVDQDLYPTYTSRFFALGHLLTRLLNETYEGRRIKFLNLNLGTQQYFEAYPVVKLDSTHSGGGNVEYNSVFGKKDFDSLLCIDQKKYLWEKAHVALNAITIATKNSSLGASATLAYHKGLDTNLEEDYLMRGATLEVEGKTFTAEIWAEFFGERVYSVLKVKHEGILMHKQEIDHAGTDNEFFYGIYKEIAIDKKGNLVIHGHGSVEYLPLKLPIHHLLKS